MPNVVGERFQITIDKAVREQLGIKPGDQAVEFVENGLLVVEFLPRPHDRSLRGILKSRQVPPGSTDSAAEKEAAWKARAVELGETLAADSRRHRPRARSKAV